MCHSCHTGWGCVILGGGCVSYWVGCVSYWMGGGGGGSYRVGGAAVGKGRVCLKLTQRIVRFVELQGRRLHHITEKSDL